MENNIDMKDSFNDWHISHEKTLKEPKAALFGTSYGKTKSDCKVNNDFTFCKKIFR